MRAPEPAGRAREPSERTLDSRAWSQLEGSQGRLGLVMDCAEEIQQNLAGFSQDSSFELGEVFCLPSAILFLFECSPKVFYGVEGGYGRWVVVFGDVSDSFVFEKLLGCISIVGRRQIRPEVVENDCCAFPG